MPWGDRISMPRVNGIALGAAAGAIALCRMRKKVGLPRWLSTGVAASAPISVSAAIEPGRIRRAVTWGTQMWAYKIAFEVPHDRRDVHRRRVRVDYPIRADAAIGRGKPPGQRLQERLRRPPRISLLDKALVGVYLLWEAEPHATLLALLIRRPERFLRAAARLGAVYDLTLVGYWVVPTAPPWWASEECARMNGSVRRAMLETIKEIKGDDRLVKSHETGANPWAAMPSDHFATALMTAANLYELGPAAGAAGLAYALALGFTLVYLGEHCVTDLAAGAALAGAVWLSQDRLAPLARAIAERWPHP
jgi:membrane-associated phospholipid phosphatase